MAIYTAEIIWSRSGQKFIDNRYSRKHILRFDGGIEIAGSSSPYVVPLPYSAVDAVDPEEAFVASLSSCHMLWFLSIAVKHGFVVDDYHDAAEGVMARNAARAYSFPDCRTGAGQPEHLGRRPRHRRGGTPSRRVRSQPS
jgi:organic hydroperoxide reductase OsmC/OhrA